jgi:chromosome segregation ATPase
VSLTLPRIRREPKPRKANRVETKLARTEAHLADVQEDNARLLNFKAAADDYFMVQAQFTADLEADVRRLTEQLAAEQGARAVAEADVEARDRWIKDMERELADARRRLDIGVLAEAAASRTQETDMRDLRDRFATGPVVTLNNSPQAASPTHVPVVPAAT